MEDRYFIKIVDRALRVFEYVSSQAREVSIAEISDVLDINTNMAFRLLSTLNKSGYLVQDSNSSKYVVSLKVLQSSRAALSCLDIRTRALPYMELLWRECSRANVNLAVWYRNDVIVVDRIDSESVPRTYFAPGKMIPAHATALGKILLCEIEPTELSRIIEEKGLKRYTENTIVTEGQLRDELKKVARDGIAWDIEEHIPNDNCVAAPVRDQSKSIIAAISLSAFRHIIDLEELTEAANHLRVTAKRISFAMGFDN